MVHSYKRSKTGVRRALRDCCVDANGQIQETNETSVFVAVMCDFQTGLGYMVFQKSRYFLNALISAKKVSFGRRIVFTWVWY